MPVIPTRVPLISSAQNLTDTWADLGGWNKCADYTSAVLFLKLDINDSQNARFKFVVKTSEDDTDEYDMPIENVTASVVGVASRYFEFTADSDQNMCIQAGIDNSIMYIKVQVQAGTVGATAGQIDTAYLTFGNS